MKSSGSHPKQSCRLEHGPHTSLDKYLLSSYPCQALSYRGSWTDETPARTLH